jgi:hypothetical protein
MLARRPTVPYADAKAKYDEALKAIDEFVAQAGRDARAEEAKSQAGIVRLGIVDWIGDLQKDEKQVADRKTKVETLVADAKTYAEQAIGVFKALKEGGSSPEVQAYASYNLAIAQFYRAYAEVPCSPPAMSLLDQAALGLEDYATMNEERLLGMYALDFLGKTDWERAKCKSDPKEREQAYNKAFQWFDACTNTPNDTIEHTTIIARGFYHLAQLCLEAGKQERTDFQRIGATALVRLKEVNRALKVPEGILAMLEWAEIEERRGNGGDAFKLAKQASDAAKDIGFDQGVAKANAALSRYAGKAKAADIDPDALMKIAENHYRAGKYDEAIPAFQQVILAASRSPEARERFALPAWSRIGFCFNKQELFFEAAAAWEVVVEAWRTDPKKGREGEPKTDQAWQAAQGMKSAYEALATRTRDPVLQARLAKVREEIPKLFPMVSSAQDQAYAQALTLLGEAFKEIADDKQGASGRGKLDRARAALRETAVNVKSERQDNAWSILVETENRLGLYDGKPAYEAAVKVADEAFAYWESPPAKKRLQDEAERIGANRTLQKARVTMQKARALVALGRNEEALALAKGYAETWPAAEPLWKELAAGVEAKALVALGKIPEAEAAIKVLTEKYPGSNDLGPVVILVANHYQALAEPMEKRIAAIAQELTGTREAPGLEPRLNAVLREELKSQEALATLQVNLERWELILRNARLNVPPQPGLVKQAEDEIAKIQKQIADEKKVLADVQARKGEIEPKIPPLLEERDRLRREVAGPMAMAARRYVEWDEAVKKQDAETGTKTRSASNVQNFAYRYYYLAQLRPEELEYWKEARRLYEEYFALPEGKGAEDEKRRKHLTYFGESIYTLAVAETDAAKAAPLYEQAVANLEKGLARVSSNTPLVVGLLSGEYVTLPFRDPAQNRVFHFPVKRAAITDAAAFRKYVQDLKETDLPAFPPHRAGERVAYAERALRQFQGAIAKMDEPEARRTVESIKKGGFDPAFFAEHADASPESLLPLARAYIRSGVQQYAVRARNAAQILVQGLYAVDTGSPEWWQAQTVILNYLVSQAERGEAAEAKIADKMLVTFKRMYPRLGGAQRHAQTLAEWKAIQARLTAAAAKVGVPTANVDLEADTPPAAAPTESPPTPGAAPPAPGAAPPAPAGGSPGATENAGGEAAGMEGK